MKRSIMHIKYTLYYYHLAVLTLECVLFDRSNFSEETFHISYLYLPI